MSTNLFCPECSKYIDTEKDWRCPFCDQVNGIKRKEGVKMLLPFGKGSGFYDHCSKCKKIAAMFECPHCKQQFLLNSAGDYSGVIKIEGGLLSLLGSLVVDGLSSVAKAAIQPPDESVKEKNPKLYEARKNMHEATKQVMKDGFAEASVQEVPALVRDFVGVLTGRIDAYEIGTKRLQQRTEELKAQKELLKAQEELSEQRGQKSDQKTPEEILAEEIAQIEQEAMYRAAKERVRARSALEARLALEQDKQQMKDKWIGGKPIGEYTARDWDVHDKIEKAYRDATGGLRFAPEK